MSEGRDISIMRILLVGVQDRDERAFRAALKAEGIKSRISVCKNAAEALGRLNRGPAFHVVVAEDRLPKSSGLELIISMGAMEASPALLLLVDDRDVERIKEVILSGVDQFLLKDSEGMYFEFLPALLSEGIRRKQKQLEQRQRESRLHKRFTLYRALFEEAGDAIFLMKGDRIVECNPQTLSIFGASRDGIINKALYDFSPVLQADGKVSKKKAFDMIERAAQQGSHRFEWMYSREDGSTFDAEVSLTPVGFFDETYVLAIVRDITEPKRATETLRKVEATTSALLNAPTDTAILLELDGTIVSCNEATAWQLGMEIDALIGRNIFALFSPEVGRRRKAQAEKVVQTKRAVRFEDERQGRWYDNNLYPVYDEEGEVVRIAVFARDITTRRSAERELEIMSSAVEQSTNSIIIVNLDGVVEYANPASTGLYKLKPEDIIGKNWRSFLSQHSTLRDNFPQIQHTVLVRGEMWRGETSDRSVDGELAWRQVSFVPIKDDEGEISQVVYISEDITERKRAEQNLALTYHGIDQAQIGLFQVDDAGTIYYANQHACASLGYSYEELLCMRIWEIDPNLSEARWAAHRKSTRERGAATFETTHRRKDGTEFPIEVTINFVTLGDKSISISVTKDITERKRAERELRYSFEFESLVAAISTRLLSITRETFDAEIDQSLKELGEFLQVQRCGLHQRSSGGGRIDLTHEWCAEGVSSSKAALSDLRERDVPWTIDEMRAGEILHVRSIDDLPPKAKAEMEKSLALGVRSFIEIPMIFEGLLIGALGMSYDPNHTEIPEEAFPLLATIGETIASAIVRNRAENALRRERDLVRNIMETSPIGITVVDRDGQITFANTSVQKVLGLKKDEITQRTFNAPTWRITDFDGDSFPDEQLPFLRVKTSGKAVYDVRHAIEWPDGRRVLLSINAAPLFDQGGDFEGMVATVEDITDRVQTETALRSAKEFAENLVETASVIVVTLDEKAVITSFNKFAEGLTGYKKDEVIGKNWFDVFIPGRDLQNIPKVFEDALKNMPEVSQYENPIVTKSETERLISWSNNVLRNAAGNIDGVLSIGMDITERKRSADALHRNAERLRILHEIDRSILQAESSEAIARGALNRIRELIPCQQASVSLLDFHDEQTMQILVAVPSGSEFSTGRKYQVPWMSAGTVESRGHRGSIYVEDIRTISQPTYLQKTLAAEGIRSFVNVPMILQGEYIGSLNLGATEPGFFTADHIEIANEVAASLAISIHQAHLLEMEQRRRHELEIFEGVSIALRGADNQEDLLSILLEEAMVLFHADASAIWLPQTCELEHVITEKLVNAEDISPSKQILKTDLQSILDVDRPTFISELPFRVEGVSSMLVAPLRAVNLPDRTLALYYVKRNDFTEGERRMVTAITDMVVIALGRLAILESLEKQVVERTREITTLYELAEISASSEDLNTSLAQSLDKVLETAGCNTGTIHLLNDDGTRFELAVQRGLSPEMEAEFITVSPEDAFWGQIIEKDEPLLLLNLRDDAHTHPVLLRSPLQCFVGAPISVGEETVGIIALFHLSEHDLSLDEIGLLNLVSDQIGLAVERTRLREQARHAVISHERQRLARELHDAVTQSLYSLSFMAKASSNFARTGQWDRVEEHLVTVQETAQQALKEMRLLVYELMPASLEEQGLVDLLRQRLDFVERRSGVDTDIVVEGEFKFPSRIQIGMYRIAEETLNNTLKHASATEVVVRLISSGNRVEMEIEDNGKGFDPTHIAGGMGLANMRERAQNLNGELTVDSDVNLGTKVKLVIHEVLP